MMDVVSLQCEDQLVPCEDEEIVGEGCAGEVVELYSSVCKKRYVCSMSLYLFKDIM